MQRHFVKQLTAAGFQLKGSGWYVTDFRGGETGKKKPPRRGEAEQAGRRQAADKADDADRRTRQRTRRRQVQPTSRLPLRRVADSQQPAAAAPAAISRPRTSGQPERR